ncbi:aminotransferase class V-fold PLP-dependent enzyme [Ktedonobacter racemifer]|uniref:Aminotransferase class V n=1 Tax=Ktedonobacter racemifer DSM 44963 TaxID=485913 RepID=D6U1K4_KTERA|nr:aminotransferase class V-fold PLP-dependent enzyme [Ktedonobacter racemifer]EFH82648.1 aminotransferase class V [Ktedonobacter racemifer DSM 44963]
MSVKQLLLPVAAEHFQVRPDITFLNHGSFGACPRPVFATYQQWQSALEADPVEFLGRRIDDLLREARLPLAAYLGTQADHLVFVPNTTAGVNIVARSLQLGPGDEVLATDHEYGASDRTWRFLCTQRGMSYINQPIPLPLESEEEMVEQFWQGVTPRTKVIFISHITSPTALIFPMAKICQRAREAGILTVIDGAHAPGQIPLNLEEIGADFYIGNCHKWLCAPKGSAFLYASPEHQALLQPLIVSWGYESLKPGISSFQDYFGWVGTDDPAAFLSVPSAIAFQQEHNWDAVRAACHELAASARQEIASLLGTQLICSDTWWNQMCTIQVPDGDSLALQRTLRETWHIEMPVVVWNNHRYIRLSIQGYNSPADVERLLTALHAIFVQ